MAKDYRYDATDLVEHRIPCMSEGCNKLVIVQIEAGTDLPRGLRKWCPTCQKRYAYRASTGRAHHNQGNRRA